MDVESEVDSILNDWKLSAFREFGVLCYNITEDRKLYLYSNDIDKLKGIHNNLASYYIEKLRQICIITDVVYINVCTPCDNRLFIMTRS